MPLRTWATCLMIISRQLFSSYSWDHLSWMITIFNHDWFPILFQVNPDDSMTIWRSKSRGYDKVQGSMRAFDMAHLQKTEIRRDKNQLYISISRGSRHKVYCASKASRQTICEVHVLFQCSFLYSVNKGFFASPLSFYNLWWIMVNPYLRPEVPSNIQLVLMESLGSPKETNDKNTGLSKQMHARWNGLPNTWPFEPGKLVYDIRPV